MNVLQRVSVVVPGSLEKWIDTGLIVGTGETLRIQAVGTIQWGGAPGGPWSDARPEGVYSDNADHSTPQPLLVAAYNELPDSWAWPITNTVPLSLDAIALPLSSDGPPVTPNSNALRPNRDGSFTGQEGRVWVRFNGPIGRGKKCKGQFIVTVERQATETTLPAPRGGRFVPVGLQSHLLGSSQTPAWLWAIKPVNGPWEGYTSLDKDLECPAYTSPNSENEIPAQTYRCGRGVDLSQIPCTLKMEADGVDVTVLGFDAGKLRSGYYDDATVEIFEVNWDGDLGERWVAFSGRFGTGQGGEMSAQIELVSWEEIATKPTGERITYTCRFAFGGRGCRVEEINSGIVLADWTRTGTVLSKTGNSKVRVRLSGVTSALQPFSLRLGEGTLGITSGTLSGAKRDVKRGTAVSGSFTGGHGDYDLELHVALPNGLEVGDTISVISGCEHTPEACRAYGNFINYGGFPYPPQQDEVNNQK